MHTIKLGKRGAAVGAVGLGCMGMSFAYDPHGRDDDRSVRTVRRALELGVSLVDTADIYGPYTNEELVGRAVTGELRSRAVLATKVGFVTGEQRLVRNGRPEHIRSAVNASLRRLGTDHLDLYQLHRVDPEVPLAETWGAMAETVRAGKVRDLGLSDVTVDQIVTASAVHPVASVQAELSLWTRDALQTLLPHTEASGITLIAYSPLGRGFLTGRFCSPHDLPPDDWRLGNPRFQPDAFDANLRLVEGVREVAARRDATPAQVALAWVLAQGRRVVPIAGTSRPQRLEENAAAAGLRLDADDLAILDTLPAAVGARQ